METQAFLILLRKHRWWIFILSAVSFCIGFYFFKINFANFKAQTILLVNIDKSEQQGSTETERYAFSILNSVSIERIYSLIYSDEMVQSIDKQFDLMNHYEIDFPDEYKQSKLVQKFTSNVHLYKESENVIKLIVTDYNAEYAARFANAIANKLIEMNLLFAQKMIEQKAGLYTFLVDEITRRSQNNIQLLQKSFTDAVNINYNKKDGDNLKHIFDVQSKLDETLGTFKNSISELSKTNEAYSWSLKAFENYKTTSIFVLNKAYPDYEGKVLRYFKALLMGIGFSLLTFCSCCVLIYSFQVNKHILKMLFWK